jgi:nicotinate-nucleotide adenylyltransferase
MKIGLLFGSFNPIHTGHLIIANHVANYNTDKVWFIVSPQNPFKNPTDLLRAEDRYRLVALALKNDERFEASRIELELPVPSYTINTLHLLSQTHPQHEFCIIMGSDNFASFNLWKSSSEIIKNYKVLVYKRPKFLISTQDFSKNIEILESPLLDISSTNIRTQIREDKSIHYLVPDKVRTEIIKNNYFR